MSDEKQILKHATEILEKSRGNPVYTLTIGEFEILIKFWIHEIIKTDTPVIPEDKLLTRQDVCVLLHCSYPTLLTYEKKGLLTGRRVGHRILFSHDDVMAGLKRIKIRELNSGAPSQESSDFNPMVRPCKESVKIYPGG